MQNTSDEVIREPTAFARKERMKGWIVSVVFGLVMPVAIVLCVILPPIMFASH